MLTSQKKAQTAKLLVEKIQSLHRPGDTLRFMEVCGTHTVAIFREGVRQLLPKGVELVSGPGCPVCVTDQEYIDKALAYAYKDNFILATFGDMLKVPGTSSSLGEAKTKGANIEIIYSPMEAIKLGRENPDKIIVFLAIGFETTIAAIAGTIKALSLTDISNVFFLVSHKLVPPALRILLDQKESRIDGFILPGHVCVITGEKPFEFLATEYKVPSCVTGFDGVEILSSIVDLMEQHYSQNYRVGNQYRSVVSPEGNKIALALIEELYEVCDDKWRGMGAMPNSGLKLKEPYNKYDVEVAYPLQLELKPVVATACQCDRVLRGIIHPDECPLFGKACTPDHAVGACMVSVEGSCSAWYKFGQSSSGGAWEE